MALTKSQLGGLLSLAALSLILFVRGTYGVAVMSVDLGTEWMKIAVVTPGVPMEIALNKESKRKTSMAVSLRGEERMFGADALAVAVKHPKSAYIDFLDLLGKKVDHPVVQSFKERYPFYEIVPHPELSTVMFQHEENLRFSVEEVVAMILEHARQIAEDYSQQKIKDAVLTIPAFFNQAERRALLRAANLANIQVLQLISEPMAVALNYGMFRRKEVNATARNILFYDMGAHDTTVSIVSYQIVQTKERGFTEKHPQAQIMGVGFDRTLGGTEIAFKIRDYLADEFNKLGKASKNVREVPRAMAKLLKEAQKVKTVLSANSNTFAQVENVMEDIDFKHEVSREKLLELNEGYFTRVSAPIEMALKSSGMTMSEVHEAILVGAGTRVPKVQEILQDYLKMELGKNMNTDEAAAMGAVYKAADLSTGFKVKKFITKDGVLYPIDVDFMRHLENEDGTPTGEVKQVKRSLFPRMNSFPQKKVMTFNKHVKDFEFNANYNDLEHLDESQIKDLAALNLSETSVTKVAETFAKYAEDETVESKGIKAHFHLDDSGLLNVTSVEAIFEKNVTLAEELNPEKKEDSWLGDTISSFFQGDNSTANETETSDSEAKDSEAKDSKKDAKDSKKKDKKKDEPKKPKIEIMKEELDFQVKLMDMAEPSEEDVAASKEKLKTLNDRDEEKRRRETALNDLESFVIDVKQKLWEDIYEKSSTEEEREKFSAKCTELSDWIDEEAGPFTEITDLEAKLKEIKELTAAWFARVREHLDRPEALGALNNMLNSSSNFLAKAKNKTGEDGFFTVAEIEVLEKKIAEIEAWKETAVKEQEEQPMHEMPKLLTSLIAEKGLDLDREVKYMVNKAKIAKAEKEREKREKEAEEKLAKEKAEKEKKKKKKKAKDDNSTTNEEEAAAGSEANGEAGSEETVAEEQQEDTQQPEESETPKTEEEEATTEEPLGEEGAEEVPEVVEEQEHTEL